jgi:cyclopropane-fatty-acyl-phospholipid synthase
MRTPRGYGKAVTRNIDSRIGPALMQEHEDMGEKEVEIFGRRWEVCI